MNNRRILLVSLLVPVVCWIVFSWPLAQYFGTGVARSAEVSQQTVRRMVPGDHLQLMYHFWLAGDMVSGKTPLFHNLYEFNAGNDEECIRKSFYFAPFSLASCLASLAGGRAFGWNIASVLSLWLTYLLTWRLVRRYNADEFQSAAAALVGLLLPYRLCGLCEGSPVGFAMAWIPALMLGIDSVMRSGSRSGAALAGCALLFSGWGDAHVFFFAILMIPVWGVITWIGLPERGLRIVGKRLLSVWPAIPFAMFSLVNLLWKQERIAGSGLGGGWDLVHVGLCSPRAGGLISRAFEGDTRGIYIGWFVFMCLGVAAIILMVRTLIDRRSYQQRTVVFLILLGVMTFVILLALGTRSPKGGLAIRAVRAIFSPYRKFRQPDKIFVVMPSLLAVMSGVALSSWAGLTRYRFWKYGCIVIFAAAILIDYNEHIAPEICLIDHEQKAYEAIVTDADQVGEAPRAVAVPLWPGDAHWSSLYQHYASLYRIRFLNGYTPVPKEHYFPEVFLKLKSMNMGEISDVQFEHLSGMGIRYLVLHEDAFPEKVSIFPVGMTLKRLLNNPRLKLLHQDESVWSFRILSQPIPKEPVGTEWQVYFPCRRWEMEAVKTNAGRELEDHQASRRRYRSIASGETFAGRSTSAAYFEGLKWQIRLKGKGVLKVSTLLEGEELCTSNVVVSADSWEWQDIPIERYADAPRVAIGLECLEGNIDLDVALLSAGHQYSPPAGGSVEITAACLFHSGYTDIQEGEVALRASTDAAEEVVYLKNLRLEPGIYRATMEYSAEGESGTISGSFGYRPEDVEISKYVTVTNGSPVELEFIHERDVPSRIAFRFNRKHDIRIGNVTIMRVE